MEEDASGDIGLSTPLQEPKSLAPASKNTTARRAPPPAISLPPQNASMWKTPSPGSPTLMSPTSATPPASSPSVRLSRSRTLPRLNSRLEPQLQDLSNGEAEALEAEKILRLRRWIICVAVVDCECNCRRSQSHTQTSLS
jgi:hypothetical protein